MRFKEICDKDNEIHFLKFMIDKTWAQIKREAARQKQAADARAEIARAKHKNKLLTSRMTRDEPIDPFSVRPMRKNKPKLY
jgi:hypothetical protein